MRSQDKIEEDKREIKRLSQTDASLGFGKYSKDRQFHTTVARRGVFRGIRQTLWRLNIPIPIPGNSASITDNYCKIYGDKSIEILLAKIDNVY